ncbi:MULTISPECIES: hypothetical protein [Rhodococcus]|uniref:Uncharacterized protein n=1 Tax=Rhodococcus opacus TaxID=37919 RepID=A0A1B1KHT8_RHOOP|nr:MULTISPECIES: hypothetical protein [Rhodococcus]ANS32182.1 hypothetical protein R1CP_37915 [Rhodococcus opacus]EJI93397.1 hypothetical protein JVH1_9306 [Rhodococcus sp. JVH1]
MFESFSRVGILRKFTDTAGPGDATIEACAAVVGRPSRRPPREDRPARGHADRDRERLTLKPSTATAFASGLLLRFPLYVAGLRADFARYETRPRTDALDWSTQWSWPRGGLHPTSFTLALGPSPFPTTFKSDAQR